jgi:methylated-DNA-[protein]-cysteine S-methyltransferase
MQDAGIYAREFDALDRYVQIGAAGEKVISLSFPRSPDGDPPTDHQLLDRIEAYLGGAAEGFQDLDVGLTVPTDDRAVLAAVRQIPYGEAASLQQVAQMAAGLDPDEQADVRTIREALATNPVPLIIPDHRISDGPSGAPDPVVETLRTVEGL